MKRLANHGAGLFLISTGPEELDVDALQWRAYQEVPGGLQLHAPSQGSLNQGTVVKNKANWTVTWGILGFLAIVITTGLALVGDILAGARDVAPIAAVSDRRRWLYGLTFCRLALPLTIAGSLSSGAYLLLATGAEQGDNFRTPSPPFALATTITAIVAGLLLAVWSAAEIHRYGHAWHPGTE